MTRVLHVLSEPAGGGAGHRLRALTERLPAEADVLALTAGPAPAGVPSLAGGASGLVPRLVAAVVRGRYDVVHTHGYEAAVSGRVAARVAGVRAVVGTEDALGTTHLDGRRITPAVRRRYLVTERLASVTVAVSATVATRLEAWGVRPGRIAVIPPGLDPAAYRFDPELRAATRAELGLWPTERVVGAVGRLDAGNRFDVLLRAAARLDATLLVVGDGPDRAALERLAARLGLADRVRFTGEVDKVRPLLCAMDVLAAPGAESSFGLAVLEALACGLPVVYGSCPAVEALPPEFAPAAVRGAVDELDLRRERVSAPAAAAYPPDRSAALLAETYDRLLGGRPSHPECR
jgi:glycosyltransferase involved in cell wall biosynthesis